MDRFSKTCLVLIVLLLAVIALRPTLAPAPALAAPHYRYMVVFPELQNERLQDGLDRYSDEGWEFIAAVSRNAYVGLIFRRAAP